MRITCPFCHSEATLHPNPAHGARDSLPRYLLTCSGCVRTNVRQETPDLLLAAPESAGLREGGGAYTAVRGWVVTNGEIHALTGQQRWEASRSSEPRGRSSR